MSDLPLVSVVMPVKLPPSSDSQVYLKQAIQSILYQTYSSLELIIIDGSSVGDGALLRSYATLDKRVRVVREDEPGLTRALNQGCRLAAGKYIALMDSDDVSVRTRVERQVAFLERHPDVGALGGWMEILDDFKKSRLTWRNPTNPALISWSLIFGNCISQPSVTMRAGVAKSLGFYDPHILHAQDYDLWARMSLVSRIANLPEVLLQYRITAWSTTLRNPRAIAQTRLKVTGLLVSNLTGNPPSPALVQNLFDVTTRRRRDEQSVIRAITFVKYLVQEFLARNSQLTSAEKSMVLRDAESRVIYMILLAGRDSPSSFFRAYFHARRLFPPISRFPFRHATRELLYSFLNRPMEWWVSRDPGLEGADAETGSQRSD